MKNPAAQALGKLSFKKRFAGMTKAQISRQQTIYSEKAREKRIAKAKK